MTPAFFEALSELKTLLLKAQDLAEPAKFFFDRLGNNAAFVRHGKIVKHGILKSAAVAVATGALGPSARVTALKIFALPGTSFHHGLAMANGRPMMLFYFDDVETGLVALMHDPTLGYFSYVRISASTLDPKRAAHLAIPANRTIQ